MAYYGKDNDVLESILGALFFWVLLPVGLYDEFGWTGVFILFAIYGTGISVIFTGLKLKTYFESLARCAHGVVGAKSEPTRCQRCQQEQAIRNQLEKETAEKRAAEMKLERQREYAAWVAEIRLPEFLISMNPVKFEHLVCDLFRKQGYMVENTAYSGDHGIDGLLRKNGGLIVLQCKRVKSSIGEPVLRDLFGTMRHLGADNGLLVTTGSVSRQAREWAKDKPLRIIERTELVELIRETFPENDVVPEDFHPDKNRRVH